MFLLNHIPSISKKYFGLYHAPHFDNWMLNNIYVKMIKKICKIILVVD